VGNTAKTGGPFQDVGNPLYDGISGGWLDEEIDLQPIIGHTVLLRFQMISDGFIEGNGINIDDVTINTNISQSIIETTTSTTVVPNPASNKVAIQHKGKATTVTISNATGQVVKQINVDANQTLILDISTWPDGMYFYATPHMPTKKWVVMH
jgi:bacillopeptidase F (M6 metalloprotease family)